MDAAVAYEVARACADTFKGDDPSDDQVKEHVTAMRKAAFTFKEQVLGEGNKRLKTSDEVELKKKVDDIKSREDRAAARRAGVPIAVKPGTSSM